MNQIDAAQPNQLSSTSLAGSDRSIAPATLAWFFALVGWTALVCSMGLSSGAYFEPTDGWVSQTAREMYEAGEWNVPQFSGELRLK
ncbi:MAG: hypothetical protein AB7N71_12925, partial [Phycisphaerae bacterium]